MFFSVDGKKDHVKSPLVVVQTRRMSHSLHSMFQAIGCNEERKEGSERKSIPICIPIPKKGKGLQACKGKDWVSSHSAKPHNGLTGQFVASMW